jgi:Zn-dependent peptidase ImmA (M78 family)
MSKIINELEELSTNILMNNDMLKIPVDVLKLAKLNDIRVYEADLEKNISGAIRYDKETKKFEILINKNDSPVRQRFTIAHELGHFFLHKEILENEKIHIDIMYRMPDEKEKEVDYFAGALLMNKILLEKMYDEDTSILDLAQLFKVSVSAMTVRLDILNLL